MFQFETQYYANGESSIKKYYNNAKTFEQAKEITSAADNLSYGFSKFEQNIFTLMENFTNLCLIDSFANIKNFDRFLKYVHNMGLEEIVKFLIEDTYYETGDEIISILGEDSIIDYVKRKLTMEIEAYEAENEVVQKYSSDNFRKLNARFTVEVYKEILKIVNNLKAEKIS